MKPTVLLMSLALAETYVAALGTAHQAGLGEFGEFHYHCTCAVLCSMLATRLEFSLFS